MAGVLATLFLAAIPLSNWIPEGLARVVVVLSAIGFLACCVYIAIHSMTLRELVVRWDPAAHYRPGVDPPTLSSVEPGSLRRIRSQFRSDHRLVLGQARALRKRLWQLDHDIGALNKVAYDMEVSAVEGRAEVFCATWWRHAAIGPAPGPSDHAPPPAWRAALVARLDHVIAWLEQHGEGRHVHR